MPLDLLAFGGLLLSGLIFTVVPETWVLPVAILAMLLGLSFILNSYLLLVTGTTTMVIALTGTEPG